MVSFLAYIVILTLDKNTTDFWLSLTLTVSCPLSKLKLKQDSWFYSHLGHCSLGGISQEALLVSPPSICLLLTSNNYISWSFAEITP